MNEVNKSTTLAFLIYPGFPMACLTSAIEPLRAANEIVGQKAFAWQLISETGGRVSSSAEVGFDPDHALEAADNVDYLFLLKMGAISGGVFPLARSGLLSGYKCSVHWCYEAAFAAEFPDHAMTGDVINIDKNRYTASGAAAAFDLMLHLIDEKLGQEVTTEVACWFQHPLMRGAGVRQKTPTVGKKSTSDMLPPVVAQAVEIFASRIADPIAIEDVAKAVGVSSRRIERSFKQATGQSPSHYYRALRMNAARQLVLYSKDTMIEIANAVGYCSAAPMIRHYKQSFGLSPSEDRKTINIFRVENNSAIPST